MINKLKKNSQKVDNFLINFLKKQNNSLKYEIWSTPEEKIRTTIILDTGKFWN